MRKVEQERAFIVVVAGFFWLVTAAWLWSLRADWVQASYISKWPAAPATMNSVKCVRERYGPGYRPRAELSYTYRVNGSNYNGKDKVPGCEPDTRLLSEMRLVRAYSQVYYDPASPSVSTLSKERTLAFDVVVGVMLVGLSAFLTLLRWYVIPDQAPPLSSSGRRPDARAGAAKT